MKYFEELRELGVDVDAGLERVMGDESFYEMTLDMFLDSVDENPIELTDFDADDGQQPPCQRGSDTHPALKVQGVLGIVPIAHLEQRLHENSRHIFQHRGSHAPSKIH